MRKVRPGHKIAMMLIASPTPVSVDDIRTMMEADPNLCHTIGKLSGYANDIRTYDQGDVKMHKQGRRAVAYELTNKADFNPATGQRWTLSELTQRRDECYPTDVQLDIMHDDIVRSEASLMLSADDAVQSLDISENVSLAPSETLNVAEETPKPKRVRPSRAKKAA